MADRTGPTSSPVGSVAEETARLLEALLGATPGATSDPPPEGDEPVPPPTSGAAAPCPTCGGHGDQDATAAPPTPTRGACRLCPVCQLLQVAHAVSPETVDRLADLAGALTQALRDVASSRRAPAPGAPEDGHATPPPRADVEDIVVGSDEDLEDPDPDPPAKWSRP